MFQQPPVDFDAHAEGRSAQVIQIESSKLLPLFLVLSLLSGGAIALAIMTMVSASRSETETRMLEYYVMELDGKLMASGVIEPNRSWSAQKRLKEKEP